MIALAGPNLPHEVLMAAGVHGGPLPFDPDRETPAAKRWLESKFVPWAPAVLEAWVQGEYDDLDGVLFSRADDSSQRLYYYVCELQRRGTIAGPQALIFDAAKIDREASRDHTIAQVRALARRLAVADQALENAIEQANEQRLNSRTLSAAPVCLLSGTPPPDRRLHRAIEGTGFAPVGDTLADSWMSLGDPVEARTGDPAAALGRQLHARPEGSRSFADRGAAIRQEVARSQCRAAIIWLAEEDETRSWSLPAEIRALEEAGLPHLVMTRRDWLGRDGAADQIERFLAGVAR